MLYMLVFRPGIANDVIFAQHDADSNEALESNLNDPLKQLAGIAEANRHAPEVVEAPVADKGRFSWSPGWRRS